MSNIENESPEEFPIPENLTPMERQYHEIKSRHRDKILLFRLGDFYEMFYEDAKEAASILNITLTSRKGMPMAGFPYHAANQYIYKFIAAGKKVAVCEQMEDPSQAKGLVRRDIVGIITPGTVLDEHFIGHKVNNYLCSIYSSGGKTALCFADISTGDFTLTDGGSGTDALEKARLIQDELVRFSPSEIIYSEEIKKNDSAIREIQAFGALAEAYPEWYFTEDKLSFGKEIILPEDIRSDNVLKRAVLGALRYLYETQGASSSDFIGRIQPALLNIQRVRRNRLMEIDDFTIRNLELVKNMQDGGRNHTLLETLDNTVTSMGGRLLKRWITMPLYDLPEIHSRLNCAEAFFDDGLLATKAGNILKEIGDIERLATRISLRKAIPRDLPALAYSIIRTLELKAAVQKSSELSAVASGIGDYAALAERIQKAVREEPSTAFNGEVIRDGFHPELDSLRTLMLEGKDTIVKLQNRERARTGISTLKIKYNNIFGYFIEVSHSNVDHVPPDYIKKQTLVNAERYTIPELAEYEAKIASASEKVAALEEELFNALIDEIAIYTSGLLKTAAAVARLDVFASFAETARENRYVKPRMDMEDGFEITEGRHPVVEKYLGRSLFVPNDALLDGEENRILILTGPNMAGKSTYLRQNALIAIMAQMGSFVPASRAKIGLIDRIFTRIGASDNLSQGLSTFLVEMQEAANILRNSTSRSLIIMDELGRGTSTYDGLSIAWAVIEYIHENRDKGGKTLFATHYHELTKLGEKKGIQNFSFAVREVKEELVFLRKVISGPADRSYGIFVAKLAGIPAEIIERAKVILHTLETEGGAAAKQIEAIFDREYRRIKQPLKNAAQFELFSDRPESNVAEKIKNLDINAITPLEAITFLAEIQKELGKR